MVKYCMSLSDEKKETAIKIALESKGNVRKRKIAVPLLMILGIVIIFSSIFLIINSPAILWYVYMVIGIVCLLLAFNAKSFQKFVLKKAELLLDKSFRTGIVELFATVGRQFLFISAVPSPALGSAKKRELLACPSKSITSTFPRSASSFARFIAVVVFPTPPL